MLTLTWPHKTAAHALPVGAKLALLSITTFALFSMSSPIALGLIFIGFIALAFLGGRDFAQTAIRAIWPLWPFVAAVALYHLYWHEMAQASTIILRMLAGVFAANLMTMTTRLGDILAFVQRLLQPLARFGVPAAAIGLAMTLMLRFLPVMLQRLGQLGDAFSARGKHRLGRQVFGPLAVFALDDADRLAEAIRARGGVKDEAWKRTSP